MTTVHQFFCILHFCYHGNGDTYGSKVFIFMLYDVYAIWTSMVCLGLSMLVLTGVHIISRILRRSVFNDWGHFSKQKQKYRGMFETQLSPETRQVQETLVSTLEHLQVPKCVRRSKRPLLAYRTRCKYLLFS